MGGKKKQNRRSVVKLTVTEQRPEEKDEPTPFIKEMFHEAYRRCPEIRNDVDRITKADKDLADKIFPFTTEFIKTLLYNKHVVLMGDSLTRAIYKDLVRLLQNDSILSFDALKKRSESSHLQDRQIDCLPLDSDRVFRQAREYMTKQHLIQYFFTTRVMKGDVDKALLQMQRSGEFPDVLLLNSALWDLTRYQQHTVDMTLFAPYEDNPRRQIENEQEAMEEYLHRLSMLMRRLRVTLPPTTQVIWLCMPWPLPEGHNVVTGRTDTAKNRLLHRSVYCDGNYRAAQLVAAAGYDVLDLGFYMRNHSLYSYRVTDGVHWDAVGTRLMTQMVIGHLAKNLGDALHNEIKQKLEAMNKDVDKDYFGVDYLDSNNTCACRTGQDERHVGSYSLALQRELNEQSFKNMPEEMRKAIEQNIETLRMSELIRLRRLEVRKEDEEAVKEQNANFDTSSALLKTKDFKPQRVILKPVSNSTSKKQ